MTCVWIDMMKAMRSAEELNWILGHFAPQIHLRLLRDAVIAQSPSGEIRVPTRIGFREENGRNVIIGIGDDPIDGAAATVVEIFAPATVVSPLFGDSA